MTKVAEDVMTQHTAQGRQQRGAEPASVGAMRRVDAQRVGETTHRRTSHSELVLKKKTGVTSG